MAPDFLFNLKPTAMYTLLKTGLLLFFRESDLPTGTVSEAHLSELFEEFIQELTAYSSDDRRSIIERLRCMNFTHKQLSLFEEQKHTASEPLITDYMGKNLVSDRHGSPVASSPSAIPSIRDCAGSENRVPVVFVEKIDRYGSGRTAVRLTPDRGFS